MTSTQNSSWVLLYKIEGSTQSFIKNTQIRKEDKKGFFEFSLPNGAQKGTYRIKFSLGKNGFIDFLFNNEDVVFEFNPNDSANTLVFKESKENKLYTSFTKKIYSTQFTLDSLQSEYFKKPSKEIKDLYRKHLVKIKAIESNFISASKGKLVNHFIKASLRYNSPVIFDRPINYIRSSVAHFFDHVDFSNQSLRNSTFLFDKVSEYVLFLNFAVNPKQKEENYKKASKVAIGKAPTTAFKAEVINYLISQFSEIQNATLVDHLFANYFDKLPKENQNILFKNQILARHYLLFNFCSSNWVSICRICSYNHK